MSFQKHPTSLVETRNVGKDTRIWAFVHILPEARIGADCNLCDHVYIENDVLIGDRVTVKSGVQLWDGIRVEDDVFIGPNVTFTNDSFPRSKQPYKVMKTIIRKGASIGANATILPGIIVGQNAMVGAGAVVTKDIPPNAIVVGNPARIVNYVDTIREENEKQTLESSLLLNAMEDSEVRLLNFPDVSDMRGNLTFAEFPGLLPFEVQRFFMIFDVPNKHVRGEHAHKELYELLICIHGNCSIVVDNGINRYEVTLDRPNLGLYIPPMIWVTLYKFSSDAVLLVLASDVYKADDYVRDYDEYLNLVAK